jgi:hypothetical protein
MNFVPTDTVLGLGDLVLHNSAFCLVETNFVLTDTVLGLKDLVLHNSAFCLVETNFVLTDTVLGLGDLVLHNSAFCLVETNFVLTDTVLGLEDLVLHNSAFLSSGNKLCPNRYSSSSGRSSFTQLYTLSSRSITCHDGYGSNLGITPWFVL